MIEITEEIIEIVALGGGRALLKRQAFVSAHSTPLCFYVMLQVTRTPELSYKLSVRLDAEGAEIGSVHMTLVEVTSGVEIFKSLDRASEVRGALKDLSCRFTEAYFNFEALVTQERHKLQREIDRI